MAEEEKVKIELEIPKDQLHIQPAGPEKKESIVKQATGYEAGELLSTPLRPPEPTKKRPVRGQVRSLIIGFALIPLALIAWPIFGTSVAISVALVGAALIALGVLVRI